MVVWPPTSQKLSLSLIRDVLHKFDSLNVEAESRRYLLNILSDEFLEYGSLSCIV
jgi:hypothetical protein